VREAEGGGQERSAHQGGGRRRPWRRARGCVVVHLLLQGSPLYNGEWCTLTPSPSQPRAPARERRKGGGGQGWGQAGTPETLTLASQGQG
jgi:hypothetical protein